ncbi:MAG: hypothetical protein LBP21_03835 [Synergistaceae bacterium]|jgi:curli biogenesis system outer membrane secretion channel CsgG|nr:hypothetical protein [Synergistaceae bacterium]
MKKGILILCFVCLLATGAEGADKIRVGVLEFESKLSDVSDRQAAIVTDIFLRTLLNSKSINIYERRDLEKIAEEQRLSMSGLVDEKTAVEIGKIHGVQYLVFGSITELGRRASGGNQEARATLGIRVVDVATSQIQMSVSESGFSNSNQKFFADNLFSESEITWLEARAIMDAASRLGHVIREKLGREYTYIISASGKNYRIDAGSYKGVQDGALYLAYADGKPILDTSDKVIEFEKVNLAVLRVQDVQDAYSVCVLESSTEAGLIRKGDKIHPVAPPKVAELPLAASRPSASSETLTQLFTESAPPDPGPTVASVPSSKTRESKIPTSKVAIPKTPAPKTPALTTSPAHSAAQISPAPAPSLTPQPTSPAFFDSEAPKWLLEKSDVPIQLKKESNQYFVVEGISGGIKAQTRKGCHYWRSWHVGTAMTAAGKLWGFEGEIERLDTGGSGIMFGDQKQEFLAACLVGGKLKLIQYKLRPARTTTLSEVPLEEKHKKPGKFTLRVEVVRGAGVSAGSIVCAIDDTTYSFKGTFKIPLLKQYGFFGSAADSSVSTTSIFGKISIKRGKGS